MVEMLENLLNEMELKVDAYDEEYYVTSDHSFYTVEITVTEVGYDLATTKKNDSDEELSNRKQVKSLKAVKTYLNKFI